MNEIENKALREYLNNESTPLEICEKYGINRDKFRKLIENYLKWEELKDEWEQVGNPFIDIE